MSIDKVKKGTDVVEGIEVISEQDISTAPVSQTRLVSKEILEGGQVQQEVPMSPAFTADVSSRSAERLNKWEELSEGIQSFNTGSYKGG